MSPDHALEPVEQSTGESRPCIDGRFTVLALLGRGGMAEVFRVRDEVSGQELALKRLRRERLARGELPLAQFEREYHTLAQLDHPSVIKVYDYVVGAEGAYYTMELLDGEDLRQGGALPWQRVCSVLGDLISVLALLHSRRWLHRDLSPRNVVCTRAGLTKLIDFGAMAPMGVSRAVVGTPPYVPPEALQQLALDARADLYAFGALAYRLLTGRSAYPARSFAQLPDIWRTRPAPPAKLVPEIPAALSALVMELLSMERGARPGTASEVMERLDAILPTAPRARPDARASYLATPKLIGRERALVKSRRHLVRSLQGHGSGMLIHGAPGVGRSRFLDVCVLEAKLLGATVLRADGSDGASGDYGVARSLGEQLLTALPDLAAQAARLLKPVLIGVIPGLAELHQSLAPANTERRHLQTALRDWFRNVARHKRILIAIDDLERVDEPSAALLSALAHRSSRRKLIVVASVQRQARDSPAIELFSQITEHVELNALSASETESLLQSVFGNASHLAPLAQYVHGLSQGNPRQVMQLAEHLVSSGHARYAAGSWTLPERLSPAELPASIDAALCASLNRLSAQTHELAQVLALTDPTALSLEDYASLLDGGTHARAFEAIAELIAADILQPEGERYRFSHPRWRELLSERIPPALRPKLHARLLPLAARFREVDELPYHLMHSGQPQRALELLIQRREQGLLTLSARSIRLHELALERAQELGLSPRLRLSLRLSMVLLGGVMGERKVFLDHVEFVLPELERASGLQDYNALGELLPQARASLALERAQARHDALPEQERSLNPTEALRELAWLQVGFESLARITLDAKLCDRLQSLRDFAPDSTLAALMHQGNAAQRLMHKGQLFESYQLKRDVLTQVRNQEQQLRADPMHTGALAGLLAIIGIEEAAWARPQTSEYVEVLLQQPGQRSQAWRVRGLYQLMLGNAVEARQCMRRAQLLSLQDHRKELPSDLQLVNHAVGYFLSDDLGGLKQLESQLERLAERYPGWQTVQRLVRCHHLRLSGDISAALELAESFVRDTPPCSHLVSCWAASVQVWLLSAAGRTEQAAERGVRYLQAFQEQGCQVSDYFDLARATAEVLAQRGQLQAAYALADVVVTDLEGKEFSGIVLGACYETRARVALAAQDRADFERWAERCGRLYNAHDNPALTAKYARLLPRVTSEQAARPQLEQRPPSAEDGDAHHATEWSLMAECISSEERAHCALNVVLEQFGSSEGHLYGLVGGRLTHLASRPHAPNDQSLREFLEYKVQVELAAEDTTGGSDCCVPEGNEGLHRRYQSVVLSALRDGEPLVAAIAAISRDGHGQPTDSSVLAVLAESLLEYDDVDPLTQLT